MGELSEGGGVFVHAVDWCVRIYFDLRPGKVMPPRIGLAMVLCFVFPCLVQGVDILMAPNGNGSLFSASFARRSSDMVDIYNKK
jgi:hypothetical protein